MVAEGFTIREMTTGDVDFGLSLGEMSGWNQVRTDWLRIVNYEPQGCFVGMINRTPVSTITTTTYGTELAWIGMMLVHPDYRRQGIASALMKHAIAWLDERQIQCIKLDATPAGAPVYEQLGFQNEWNFHRYSREGEPSETFVEATSSTFEIHSIDEAAFGVNRSNWLQRLAADSHAETYDSDFGMLRSGRLATYLGPVIAEKSSTAEALIGQLLAKTNGPVFWDVPGPNATAVELAEQFGFQQVRPLTRMWRGKKLVPGLVEHQFALASPATG